MKKILIVIPTLRMGGAEKSLVSLLKALDPQRVAVDLYLFEGGGVLQAEVPEWVNILEADAVTRGMTLELRNYLLDLLCSGNFCAALTRIWITLRSRISKKKVFNWNLAKKYIPSLEKHYDVAVGFLEGVADFFVLDKVKAEKKIGWIHTDFSVLNVTVEEAEYYCRFDKIATISELCREMFIKTFPETRDKIHIIENIVLPDSIKEKAAMEVSDKWPADQRYNLVTVSRLSYGKGMDIAVKAAKILSDRNVRFCWHVYGQGTIKAELESFIEDNGLRGIFVLEGLRENPYPYMKRSDMIVQPSRSEGKSLVLDEAKILGKAIVVTDYPSVGDQIKNRVTGITTAISPEGIADGIVALLNDPDLKARLEANAAAEPNRSIRALDAFYNMIEA